MDAVLVEVIKSLSQAPTLLVLAWLVFRLLQLVEYALKESMGAKNKESE